MKISIEPRENRYVLKFGDVNSSICFTPNDLEKYEVSTMEDLPDYVWYGKILQVCAAITMVIEREGLSKE